eukprot:12145995-Alexandrium_andersonii.AAC.1
MQAESKGCEGSTPCQETAASARRSKRRPANQQGLRTQRTLQLPGDASAPMRAEPTLRTHARARAHTHRPVSYTHLTLPTIC